MSKKEVKINQLQKYLHDHYIRYPEDSSYNITYAYEFTGTLDTKRLKVILNNVIDMNEIFKTNFETINHQTFMLFDENRKYYSEIVSVQADSKECFVDKTKKIVSAFQDVPIILENWPLITMKIFCCENIPDVTIVACSIPHIIADVYSFYSFLNLVCDVYNKEIDESEIRCYLEQRKGISYLDIEPETFITHERKNGYEIKKFGIKQLNQFRENNRLKGHNLEFEIKNKQKIDCLLKKFDITPFTFFLAIHAIVLSKVIGLEEITIGIPLANRKKEYRETFGYFVNTLPMSIEINENMTLEELVRQISRKLFVLLKNQNIDIRCYLNGEDYINNCFTYYKESLTPHFKNVITNKLFIDNENIQFEVSALIKEKTDSYVVYYELGKYFDGVNIERIFTTVLKQMLQENKSLKEIRLLETKDVEKEYRHLNPSEVVCSSTNWIDIFDGIVSRFGDRLALVSRVSKLTYRELDKKSNLYAAWLWEKYRDIQNVVVSVSKDIELVVLIIAIRKVGKTYVPVPESIPNERKKKILNGLNNYVLINNETINLIEDEMSHVEDQKIRKRSNSEIAYIIYTSGTTGNPKGVEISEKNLVNMIISAHKEFCFSENDVWAFVHSYSFDASIWEMFCSLSAGSKLVIVDERIKKYPKDFRKLLYKNKVTIMLQTPTAFKMLSDVENEFDNSLFLRVLFLGAEELQFSILSSWIKKYKLDKMNIYNLYGPTESTVVTTYYKISEGDIQNGLSNIIGIPFSHLECFIVDKKHNILPRGVEGELAISGSSVAHGYRNEVELNKEKFIVLENGKRVYLTGDKVKLDSNRQLQYLGRMDRQFQIRGFRVECGEIETIFEQTYHDSRCVVDCVELRKNELILVAYYIYEYELDVNKVKQELRKNLPDYMIPVIVAKIDEIPFTTNGKVDYEKLKLHLNVEEISNNKFRSDATVEEKIMAIISKIVGHSDFKLEDELINIGVSSIHIPHIFDEIVKEFALENWDIADLFDVVTTKDLVLRIEEEKKNNE